MFFQKLLLFVPEGKKYNRSDTTGLLRYVLLFFLQVIFTVSAAFTPAPLLGLNSLLFRFRTVLPTSWEVYISLESSRFKCKCKILLDIRVGGKFDKVTQKLQTRMEFINKDFNGDKSGQYEEVRKEMAWIYCSIDINMFGPESVMIICILAYFYVSHEHEKIVK